MTTPLTKKQKQNFHKTQNQALQLQPPEEVETKKEIEKHPQKESLWTKWKNRPPSFPSQKVGLWTGVILTAATTYLAFQTYNTQVDIKNMDSLLKATNVIAQQNSKLLLSFKPSVKIIAMVCKEIGDSTVVETTIKNFGGRSALEIVPRIWIWTPQDYVAWGVNQYLQDVSSGQQFDWRRSWAKSDLTKKIFESSRLVIKFRYKDAIDGQLDSIYTYGQILTDKSGETIFNYFTDSNLVMEIRNKLASKSMYQFP